MGGDSCFVFEIEIHMEGSSLEIQIEQARKRAEQFSRSLHEAREQESLALKILESERSKWTQSFEEKSVMIDQLERELASTVDALQSEREVSRRNDLSSPSVDLDQSKINQSSVNQSGVNVSKVQHSFNLRTPPSRPDIPYPGATEKEIRGLLLQTQGELERLQSRFGESLRQTEQLQEAKRYLELEVDKLQKDKTLLQTACRDADGKLQFRMSQVIEYEQEKERFKQIEAKLREEIDLLQSRVRMSKSESEDVSVKLNELALVKEEKLQLSSQLTALMREREEVVREEQATRTQLEDLQQRFDALEKQSNSKISEGNAINNRLRQRILELERNFDEVRDRADSAELELAKVEKHSKTLQKELQVATDKNRGVTKSVTGRIQHSRSSNIYDTEELGEREKIKIGATNEESEELEESDKARTHRHHSPYENDDNGTPFDRAARDKGNRMGKLISVDTEREMLRDNQPNSAGVSSAKLFERRAPGESVSEYMAPVGVASSFPPPTSNYASPSFVPPAPPTSHVKTPANASRKNTSTPKASTGRSDPRAGTPRARAEVAAAEATPKRRVSQTSARNANSVRKKHPSSRSKSLPEECIELKSATLSRSNRTRDVKQTNAKGSKTPTGVGAAKAAVKRKSERRVADVDKISEDVETDDETASRQSIKVVVPIQSAEIAKRNKKVLGSSEVRRDDEFKVRDISDISRGGSIESGGWDSELQADINPALTSGGHSNESAAVPWDSVDNVMEEPVIGIAAASKSKKFSNRLGQKKVEDVSLDTLSDGSRDGVVLDEGIHLGRANSDVGQRTLRKSSSTHNQLNPGKGKVALKPKPAAAKSAGVSVTGMKSRTAPSAAVRPSKALAGDNVTAALHHSASMKRLPTVSSLRPSRRNSK